MEKRRSPQGAEDEYIAKQKQRASGVSGARLLMCLNECDGLMGVVTTPSGNDAESICSLRYNGGFVVCYDAMNKPYSLGTFRIPFVVLLFRISFITCLGRLFNDVILERE